MSEPNVRQERRVECVVRGHAHEVKDQRARTANEFLRAVASCGRKFFSYADRVAEFEVDRRGKVWLTDAYTCRRIYTHYRYNWRGFTNGGTMRSLIESLRDYIRTGAPPLLNLGPWPDCLCNGDLWGYGPDMQRVRDAAAALGLVPSNA